MLIKITIILLAYLIVITIFNWILWKANDASRKAVC